MNEQLYNIRDTLLKERPEDRTMGDDEASIELVRRLGPEVDVFYDASASAYEAQIASNGTIPLSQEEAHQLFVDRVLDMYQK